MFVFLQELQGIIEKGLNLDLIAWLRYGEPFV
jgi:hypothetical protein